jgi:hypothetical protein
MVLNPSKLAGQCGRLKCCLVYEHQMYKEMGKGLPKVGKKVVTPSGPGRVLDLDILGQRVRVLLEEGGAQTFTAGEVRSLHAGGGAASGKTPDAEGLADASEPSDPAFSTELGELAELRNAAGLAAAPHRFEDRRTRTTPLPASDPDSASGDSVSAPESAVRLDNLPGAPGIGD